LAAHVRHAAPVELRRVGRIVEATFVIMAVLVSVAMRFVAMFMRMAVLVRVGMIVIMTVRMLTLRFVPVLVRIMCM
jgi:hypothetical protein